MSQWLKDFRWALNMARARQFRRSLGLSEQRKFDDALRPGAHGAVFNYPDAFYYITIDDLLRAMDTI